MDSGTRPAGPGPVARRWNWRRGIAGILLVVAAAAWQRAATSPWGAAATALRDRIEVSPIGVARTDATGALQVCRWWPVTGEASLCRTAATSPATAAMSRLRLGYPLLQIGFWTGVIALFLVVLRVPRRPAVRVGVTAIAAASGAAGTLCVVRAAPVALDVLGGVSVRFGLSGAVLAWAGIAAALASLVLQLSAD